MPVPLRQILLPTLLALIAGASAAATGAAPAPAAAAPASPVTRTVVIVLYEDVEAQDFGVPFEVLTTASDLAGYGAFKVLLAAETPGLVAAHNGLRVMPDCTFASCPPADILVVPGGAGIFKAMQRPAMVEFVRKSAARAEVTAGVCIGSMLLAKAGLLDGLTVTTHELGIDYLTQLAPRAKVVRDRRYIDSGKVMTSAGMVPGLRHGPAPGGASARRREGARHCELPRLPGSAGRLICMPHPRRAAEPFRG
jgi:putative intracellular protease/amidase